MIKKLSPLWVMIAGSLWGAMGIFVRRFNEYGIESMSVVFIRAAVTATLFLPLAAVFKKDLIKIRLKDVWIFAGMGLLSIVFFNFCYFSAISLMSLSAAAILLYTSPVFVMLLSALFFKERLTLKKGAAAVIAFGGLVLVTGVSADTRISAAGILFGLGSALGYALYSIFGRAAINRGYGAAACTGWSFFFAAVFSFFAADIKAIGVMITEDSGMIGFSVIFALTVTVVPYLLYTLGLSGMDNGKAAVIASVEPVAATIIGMVMYKEIPTAAAVIGIIMVIFAVILSSGFPLKKDKSVS